MNANLLRGQTWWWGYEARTTMTDKRCASVSNLHSVKMNTPYGIGWADSLLQIRDNNQTAVSASAQYRFLDSEGQSIHPNGVWLEFYLNARFSSYACFKFLKKYDVRVMVQLAQDPSRWKVEELQFLVRGLPSAVCPSLLLPSCFIRPPIRYPIPEPSSSLLHDQPTIQQSTVSRMDSDSAAAHNEKKKEEASQIDPKYGLIILAVVVLQLADAWAFSLRHSLNTTQIISTKFFIHRFSFAIQ